MGEPIEGELNVKVVLENTIDAYETSELVLRTLEALIKGGYRQEAHEMLELLNGVVIDVLLNYVDIVEPSIPDKSELESNPGLS